MSQGLALIALGGLLSGFIAIFGNQVGRFVGRKKLSIFHVRPRYTSYAVTYATGMLIFVASVLILLLLSKPVNQMLLHRDELQSKVTQLEQQLADQKQQLADGEKRLRILGDVIHRDEPDLHGNDIVFRGLIDCSVSPSDIEDQLNGILTEGNRIVVQLRNTWAREFKEAEVPESTKMLGYAQPNPNYKAEIIEQLSHLDGKHVVVLRTALNIYFSLDKFVPVNIEVLPYGIAFHQNETVASLKFTGKEGRAEVIAAMQKFLHDDVQRVLQEHQMLPPARATRVPVEFPLENVVEVQDEIVASTKPISLRVVANRDLYNVDPFDAKLEVAP